MKVKHYPWIRRVNQIRSKIKWVLPWPMLMSCHENQAGSFSVIPLTDRQTNNQTTPKT